MFPPYTFQDCHPDLALKDIDPLSRRAMVLLVRNQNNRAPKAGQMHILGAIDMLDALEYHHAAHMRVIGQLAQTPLMSGETETLRRNLLHEVMAYLNRMGQFYYFARSAFVKQFVPDPEAFIPTHLRIKRFRDKHSAHRSLDAPRPEDTPHHQHVHAWALSSFGGWLFAPKPATARADGSQAIGLRFLSPERMWLGAYHQLQLYDEDDCLNFSMEREHPLIAEEAYKLLDALITAA
jgi:hypothetical protein